MKENGKNELEIRKLKNKSKFYLWRLLAGVGHDAVVGVCPACWGIDETPLPGDDTPPETDDSPVFGSGFNFLKAPSAKLKKKKKIHFLNLFTTEGDLRTIKLK